MTDLNSNNYEGYYLNPVYNKSFPDPFVLKYCGKYWAYCTGIWNDERCFGILTSQDLVNWKEEGGAMDPLEGGPYLYWAPEVDYLNGRFYLYYSVGNETNMQIRVAVSDNPGGPFKDSGKILTTEPFAIDPHVFTDDNGLRYLFYASDFLEHSHIGTGTVMDLMLDPFTLGGNARPVARALYDWQVYDPHRIEKGGVRWHTVEGPFVLKHKGRYYEMFSGGNWKNVSYGVSYAVASNINQTGEWTQEADGVKVLPILKTVPGEVIGPGHNSVVVGPDNRQLYCVYHRWTLDGTSRVMAIDPLEWVGERMSIIGPSSTYQPVPILPALSEFDSVKTDNGNAKVWEIDRGTWKFKDDEAAQTDPDGFARATLSLDFSSFLAVLSLSAPNVGTGSFGIGLYREGQLLLNVSFIPFRKEVSISYTVEDEEVQEEIIPLAENLDLSAFQLLKLEVEGLQVKMVLVGTGISWNGCLLKEADGISLQTAYSTARFAGFGLTYGFENLFYRDSDFSVSGWKVKDGKWNIIKQQLVGTSSDIPSVISKNFQSDSYELVINVKLEGQNSSDGSYGVYPVYRPEEPGPLFNLSRSQNGWILVGNRTSFPAEILALPTGFDPFVFQQFRFQRQKERLIIHLEALLLGEMKVSSDPGGVGLNVFQAKAAFDLIRMTVTQAFTSNSNLNLSK